MYFIFVILYSLSLFFFATANSAWQGLIAIILFTIFNNLLFIKLDLLLEKFTDNSSTGRVTIQDVASE